jgi:hygromycin-B 7''-O-kinase
MRALQSLGADTRGLERVDSVTNEVWMTPEYVVRLNRDTSLRLQREAILSQTLPAEVDYPPLINYAGEVGSDWLVVRRMPGIPLSRAWPHMDQRERRDAVRQLAERLRVVHQVTCPELAGLHDLPQLLDPAPTGAQATARLQEAIDRAGRLAHVDVGLLSDVSRLVGSTATALDPFDDRTVVHGDLGFENVLWHDGQVTALLDFEFARPGPPDLDLDVFLRFCALPKLHVAPDYEDETRAEDYAEVPWWLAEDYPELYAHPRQLDRVRIYSVAWDVRELLAFPPSAPLHRLHPHHPYQRLAHVLRGTSYLDRFDNRASIAY